MLYATKINCICIHQWTSCEHIFVSFALWFGAGVTPFIPVGTPFQYPKRRLIERSRKVSKPRDLYLELSDRSEIRQALRQHCCRCACQISKQYNLKYQSRGFETSRDLTIRRLFGYWDWAQQGCRTFQLGPHLPGDDARDASHRLLYFYWKTVTGPNGRAI